MQELQLNLVAVISIGCIYSLDWTTGLTFDPKILTKTCNFALIGNPRMQSYPFSRSGREDTDFMLTCSKSDQAFMSGR